jgi:hypothetical protein
LAWLQLPLAFTILSKRNSWVFFQDDADLYALSAEWPVVCSYRHLFSEDGQTFDAALAHSLVRSILKRYFAFLFLSVRQQSLPLESFTKCLNYDMRILILNKTISKVNHCDIFFFSTTTENPFGSPIDQNHPSADSQFLNFEESFLLVRRHFQRFLIILCVTN